MCGIAGFVDWGKTLKQKDLHCMISVLHHRGPNDEGFALYETNKFKIGLGHKRLSILDLSQNGHQPMKYDNLEIVFNGEIYNFKEVRKELITFGYKFDSDSDTEVLLKAFHRWGKNSFDKFRGMWSFAIYDHQKEELILCRDRMGVKPLYYYKDSDIILFSSELKSFHKINLFTKKEDVQSLYFYFKYGYIPTPRTVFQNTYKLEPGNFLIIDKNFNIKKEIYWDPFRYSYDGYKNIKIPNDEKSIVSQLEDILKESFALRMVSDVPVGVFLSGGIDSSLVAAILQRSSPKKLNTFTIGFYEQNANEALWAKKVANYLGTNHTELYVSAEDAANYIDNIPYIFDEPFADNSSIPTLMVSKLAKQHVSVALSADGGDELFGGYTNYQPILKLYYLLKKIPVSIRKICFDALGNSFLKHSLINYTFLRKSTNSYDKYIKLRESLLANDVSQIFDVSKSYWLESELNKMFNFSIPLKSLYNNSTLYKDLLNFLLIQDQNTYMLDDILTKVDRTTMYNSLEGREPFLDNKIVEFALSLPSDWKIRNGTNKYLLKQILYKYLPKELVDRPKQGFGMPIQEWFKNDLKSIYEYYLSYESLKDVQFLNATIVNNELKEYFNGKKINSNKFWLILMYMKWREVWM